jgi:hypothetical protein
VGGSRSLVHSAGRHHQGRRCPSADRALRMAHVMMTRVARWFPLKPWAMRVAARCGAKRAKVALARRLAVVLHRMWLDGTDSRRNRYDSGAACDPIRRGKNPVGTKAEVSRWTTSDGLPPPTPIASSERGTNVADHGQKPAPRRCFNPWHTMPDDRRCPTAHGARIS